MKWLYRLLDDWIYLFQDKWKFAIVILFSIWYVSAWKEIIRFPYFPLKNNLMIGSEWAGRISPAIDASIPIQSSSGYDSQFFWVLSVDPFLKDTAIRKIFKRPYYRSQRILLPLLTWSIIRDPVNILYGLWFWSLIGILLGLFGLYRISKYYTINPVIPMLFYLINPGVVIASIHPMSDTLASGLVLLAWSYWLNKKVWVSALFFALACMTRELSILFTMVLVVHVICIEKNKNMNRLLPLGISMVPILIWEVYLRTHFGQWPRVLTDTFAFPLAGTIKSFESFRMHKVDIEDFISALCITLSCLIILLKGVRQWKNEVYFLLLFFSLFMTICGVKIMEDNFSSSRIAMLYATLVIITLLIRRNNIETKTDFEQAH